MPSSDHRLKPVDRRGARRKLAAILSADVAGYSRLMGVDETGTHRRLMAYREAIDELVVRHEGRTVGTAGDSVLADFPSVIEALKAAVDVQEALRARNERLPAEQRLEFRIGINLGDVIVDGRDIFGDGVNVASRVQGLAEPGGIAISGAVYDQVSNKLDLQFRDRGNHTVKNIAAPVRVYTVEAQGAGALRRSSQSRLPRLIWLSTGVLAALAAAGGAFWVASPRWLDHEPTRSAVETQAKVAARPAIAVLPFENQGGDPEERYFADGVTEDIITALGRFSNLLVMSWHAVLPYKDKTVAPSEIGHDLNVRYLVDGSIRRAGDQVRVTVRLTDAERGALLWSEQYEEVMEDIFALQDAITSNLVGRLAVRLTTLERQRTFAKPTQNLQAYDYVLRGRDLLRDTTRSSNLEARRLFERAAALDPNYAAAQVNLGWTYMHEVWWGWTEWPQRVLARAKELAETAIDLDPASAEAYGLMGQILTIEGEFGRAEDLLDRAIEINPNDVSAHANRGSLMLSTGRLDEAVDDLETARRFDPQLSDFSVAELSQALFLQGRYDDAIRTASRVGKNEGAYVIAQLVLAAAYAEMDRPGKAAAAAAEVRRLQPFFDVARFGQQFRDPSHREHFAAALRKVGF
jgi:adenylate cyclase